MISLPSTTDIRVTDAGFAATTVTVAAETEKGKRFFSEMFGAGAVSAELPKSSAIDFARFAKAKGYEVSQF